MVAGFDFKCQKTEALFDLCLEPIALRAMRSGVQPVDAKFIVHIQLIREQRFRKYSLAIHAAMVEEVEKTIPRSRRG